MHKEAFEPTGLIPRSIIRTFDRFRQQLLPGTEQIAIQEYRISRYQILVSIKALCTLIFVPFLVTYTVKFFLITPVTEHFWDYQQGDIFLNAYQEKRAFNEMHDFSEKIFFESLVNPDGEDGWDYDRSSQPQSKAMSELGSEAPSPRALQAQVGPAAVAASFRQFRDAKVQLTGTTFRPSDVLIELPSKLNQTDLWHDTARTAPEVGSLGGSISKPRRGRTFACFAPQSTQKLPERRSGLNKPKANLTKPGPVGPVAGAVNFTKRKNEDLGIPERSSDNFCLPPQGQTKVRPLRGLKDRPLLTNQDEGRAELGWPEEPRTTLNLQIRFQKKSLEMAETYNKQSILAITCLLGDFVTLLTLYFLFVLPQMKPQVIILKSFLTESLYSLSDTTKSFLLILGMDLLVGFHSPRGWEIVLESALRHFGLPENESFILLFVALFPVFLDTVFKYWIFRYLNKISPSTVVTYHSMLE
jgi:hypothetical protein